MDSTYITVFNKKKFNVNVPYTCKNIIIDNRIKEWIESLPIDIQKKLCIYTWRMFWREYVPLTAKIPSWYSRKLYVEKTLLDSRIDNIHFMHLEFNTLEKNKKWIMGCQCDFCKNYENNNTEECDDAYYEEIETGETFKKSITDSWASNWNDRYYYLTTSDNEVPICGYDPLYGSEYEDFTKSALRKNIQIKFSEDICDNI